ncbi:hypothetical protein QBC47DRAFT_381327 [Echria macrotheca]|uniref:Uncharacterized protein n=1 Tax=Echria macrotheca TaxID=438768 RepID=A0AAJ0BDD8_9PEZI|nr:hypothetical protein QBC47DRAFT_381327 [Echria macrotheca]
MGVLGIIHGLAVPVLCLACIPLAICAGITSTLSFWVLMCRVAVAYLDIALSLIPQYFTRRGKPYGFPADENHFPLRTPRDGHRTPITPSYSVGSRSGTSTPWSSSSNQHGGADAPLANQGPAVRRRRSSYGFGAGMRQSRHSSQGSLASMGAITPLPAADVAIVVADAGMTPSVGLDRDFEGIGGWRIQDDQEDEENWTNINSRLELPAERAPFRHHQRSLSSGSTKLTDLAGWMTPALRGGESPDEKQGERPGLSVSGNGTRSPGKALSSPGSRRLNQHVQLPSMTALDQENGYFPPMHSPDSARRCTP